MLNKPILSPQCVVISVTVVEESIIQSFKKFSNVFWSSPKNSLWLVWY